MPARRCRGEQGASLLLALGFLVLFGTMIPPLLNLGTTNLLATSRLQEQRSVVYTADGATDGAIQFLRLNTGCGRPNQTASTCTAYKDAVTSTFSFSANNQTAVTTITAIGNPLVIDRTVQLSTSVGGVVRVTATAVVHDPGTGSPANAPVDVTSWTYNR